MILMTFMTRLTEDDWTQIRLDRVGVIRGLKKTTGLRLNYVSAVQHLTVT